MCTQVDMERIRDGRRARRSRRSATSASSIRAWAFRASSASTGRSRPRAFAPFARPRRMSFIAPRRWATQLTLANGNLLSERATGWEAGVGYAAATGARCARAIFLPQVNRPIAALTTNPNSSPILLHARESRPDREPRRLAGL